MPPPLYCAEPLCTTNDKNLLSNPHQSHTIKKSHLHMKTKFTNKILLAFALCCCAVVSKAQTTVPYTGAYFNSIAVNDYISIASAPWATASTWGKVSAVIPASGSTPNQVTYTVATVAPTNALSVFVWNSNVVTLGANAVCKNIYIETGTTVNSTVASTATSWLLVVGPGTYAGTGTTAITNDGTLGTSGPFSGTDNAGITLCLANNSFNTTLTGGGVCNIAKLMENLGTHTAGSSKTFTINQDVNLNGTASVVFGGGIGGNSGDDHYINTTFTINTGKTVKFSNTDGRFNYSSNSSPSQRCGVYIYNINGTLDMSNGIASSSFFYPLSAAQTSNFNALNTNSILMLNVGATGTVKLPKTFQCNNSGSPVLTGRAAININGTVVPPNVVGATLLTGGNITFKSDATSTGSIGNMPITTYLGTTTNNNNIFTVERYIPSFNNSNTRRAYTLVSSPITTAATTINAAWQEGSTDVSTSSATAVASSVTGTNYNLYSLILSQVSTNIRKGMTVTGSTSIQAGTQVLDTAILAAWGATSTSTSVVMGYSSFTDNPYLTAGMSVTGSGIPAGTKIQSITTLTPTSFGGVFVTGSPTSTSITVSDASQLLVGMIVSATSLNVANNTSITAISGNTLTLSATVTITNATVLTFNYRILTLTAAATTTLASTLLNIGAGQILLLTKPVTGPFNSAPLTFTNNFGTQITGGAAGGGVTNGFDLPITSGSSIFTYDDTQNGVAATPSQPKWTAVPNTNINTPAKGYLLFVRGDRSVDRTTTPGSTTASATTLRATGAIGQGSVTPTLTTLTANKYNLIANPYPSAVTWSGANSVTKNNIGNSFYVYDPNNQLFYTSDGSTVSPSPALIGITPISQQQPNVIQSGQAFFIQNAATGTPSITFTETSKVTANTATNATVFGETEAKSQLNLNIYRTAGNVFADGAVALFGKDYSASVSMDEDALKFTNFNESFSLRSNDQNLSIEKRPLVSGNDTLHFTLGNFGKRDYSFVIDGNNFANTTAMLEDKYTATKQAIDLAGATTYNFTVNADAGSNSNDRFIITLGSTATIVATDVTTNNNLFVKMSPNPVSNQLQLSFKTEKAEQATIKIINSLGQVVKTVNAGKTDNGNISISVTSLSTGVYTVQLLSGDKQVTTQKLVKE